MSAFVTIQQIRDAILDRTPDDNSIENDLFFSDEEIVNAMKQTAAAYNAMAPRGVDYMDYRSMPAGESTFLDGVLCKLYKMAINKLARNVMTWQTGNTTVELEKTRMEAFKSLSQMYDQTFRDSARERKMEINRSLAWGYF